MHFITSIKPFLRSHFRSFSISNLRLELDYYKVLGVKSNASNDEIKRAYLQKCKEYHPDKNKGSKTMQAKFIQANNAYNILNNPENRRSYDLKMKNYSQGGTYHPQSPYRWGTDNQAQPEDVFREYKRHSQYTDSKRYSNFTWRYKDPIYQHWQSIYEKENSSFRKSNSSNSKRNSLVENKYIFFFLAFLFVIMYVRFVIAMRSYKYSQRHYYNENYDKRHNYPKNNEKFPIDPTKPVDLDTDTEEA